MCTVSVNINEDQLRSIDPMLTDHGAISRWVQRLVDSNMLRLMAERTSPIAYSTEQARSLVTDRLNRLENGQAETVGHDEVKREMDEEIAHMEAEERAYWAQSVERDLADMAEGKTAEYVSGDEFWSRFEQAAMKHYEDVPAEV